MSGRWIEARNRKRTVRRPPPQLKRVMGADRVPDIVNPSHVSTCRCGACRAVRDAIATKQRDEPKATYVVHPDKVRVLRIGADGKRNELDVAGRLIPESLAPYIVPAKDIVLDDKGGAYTVFCDRKLSFAVGADYVPSPITISCVWRAVSATPGSKLSPRKAGE